MSDSQWKLIIQILQFGFGSSHFLLRCLSCRFLSPIAVPEESYQSIYDFTVSSLPFTIQYEMTAHIKDCSKNLSSRPFIHTSIQIEKFRNTQRHTNKIIHSPLPHGPTHLPFHPKETVHIQTNRGDGYCPNAIILYCPSRWLLWDKGPSVDEASSVWIAG